MASVQPARMMFVGASTHVTMMMLLVLCIGASFGGVAGDGSTSPTTSVTVTADFAAPTTTVSDAFVGFTIDWWVPYDPVFGKKWGRGGALYVDLDNDKLNRLVTALAPATLRMGGTPEDTVVYEVGNPPECPVAQQGPYPKTMCLNMTRWAQINKFAADTGVDFFFGLNGLYQRHIFANGTTNLHMNTTNAREFLKYTSSMTDPAAAVFAFELSNEDNQGGKDIDPTILGEDFQTIHGYIDQFWGSSGGSGGGGGAARPILVGPDTAVDGPWMTKFLEASKGAIQAMTYHAYAADGNDPNCGKELMEPQTLDNMNKDQTSAALSIAAKFNPSLAVVGGEVGPAYGGGRMNATNRFLDSFWYLDHLGYLASTGVQRFARSTLLGGDYGLIDHATFEPNPDYFVALLWKRTCGSQAVRTSKTPDVPGLRAYTMMDGTHATVVLANMLESAMSVTLDLSGFATLPPQRAEYHVRGAGGDLTSDVAQLQTPSGWMPLQLSPSGELPKLVPVMVDSKQPVQLAGQTYAFITFH